MTTRCDRCKAETLVTTMSIFDTSTICMDCKEAERKLPEYEAAAKAEREAVMRGDYNFPGVGYPGTGHEEKDHE